jgi:hypothetical protein
MTFLRCLPEFFNSRVVNLDCAGPLGNSQISGATNAVRANSGGHGSRFPQPEAQCDNVNMLKFNSATQTSKFHPLWILNQLLPAPERRAPVRLAQTPHHTSEEFPAVRPGWTSMKRKHEHEHLPRAVWARRSHAAALVSPRAPSAVAALPSVLARLGADEGAGMFTYHTTRNGASSTERIMCVCSGR